ncbi:MAG: hypothetical protein WCQ82_02730 [Bacteroidaceae bacterium]
MGLFNSKSQKPRSFNHQYIYVNKRKEKLDEMEEAAKREMGIAPPKENNRDYIHGAFVQGTKHLRKRKENPSSRYRLLIVPALLLLLYLLNFLMTGSWVF